MKNKKRLLLCLCCAFMASTTVVGLASCGDRGNTSTPDDVTSSIDDSVQDTYYVVTFNSNGGSAVASASVLSGETVSKPETDPTKDGYVFAGWYTDSAFTKPFAFGVTPITADTTVYARFVEAVVSEYEVTVKFVVDGEEAFAAVKTTGGVAYNLPVPTKAGATFAGWWVSDFEDAEMLTYKYEEQALVEHTTLYAVWESDAPLVSVTEAGASWTAKGVANSYSVKITAPDGTVESKTQALTSYSYDFASKAAGKYTIEVTLNGKTTTVYYNNKALAKVVAFKVEDGILTFNAVKNATNYIITVDCGNDDHNHTNVDLGNKTSYDFSNCAMQKGGIKFTVKATADGYFESVSETYAYSQDLAAATGLAVDTANEQVSWAAVANATSYKVEISSGANTVTETVTDTTYALKNYTGALTIKVTPVANGYNSPDAAEIKYVKATLASPVNTRLDGSKIVWDAVAGATKYMVKIGDTEYQAETNEFVLTEAIYGEAESCAVYVKAIGATDAANSLYSDATTIRFSTMSDTLVYANGEVIWEPVLNTSGFVVKVNDGEEIPVAANATKAAITLPQAGKNTISVRCFSENGTPSDWVEIEVFAYVVAFDVAGGATVDSVFKAAGDKVALPTTTVKGYTLAGWYNTPNGTDGVKYDNEIVVGDNDMLLHAHWNPNEYTVTLVTGEEGSLEETTRVVKYGQKPELPTVLATNQGSMIFFGGWYSEPNGKGFQYADENGVATGVWFETQDMILYADWWHGLKYEEVRMQNDSIDATGYQVSMGEDISMFDSIKIPVEHNGKPVLGLASNAFMNCSNLVSIDVPETIQDIVFGTGGTYATGSSFYYCSNLRSVNIYPVSAEEYPQYASYDRNYSSDNGVIIYDNANNGREVKFVPKGLTGTYSIPQGVTTIPTRAFYQTELAKVIIPTSVTKIDSEAFLSTSFLKEVEFAAPKEGIGEPLAIAANAFKYCYGLTEIALPARIEKLAYDEDKDINNVAEVFTGSLYLENIYVANGGTTFSSKDGMLYNAAGNELVFCSRYKKGEITIPSGTTTIGKSAFEECKEITKVTIPGYVTTIKEAAFNACLSLTEVVFEGKGNDATLNIETLAFYGCKLMQLTLPENIGTVAEYAFGNNINLIEVILNADERMDLKDAAFGTKTTSSAPYYYVTNLHIGPKVPAFAVTGVFGGDKLANLTRDEANENFDLDESGVLYSKGFKTVVYFPNSIVGEYKLHDNVEEIGSEVFRGKLLTKIEIGANVKTIGNAAFAYCPYLTSVTIADGTVELAIGNDAFYNCVRLTSLKLPTRLRTVGEMAFAKMTSLAGEFEIPEGVKEIGIAAFQGSSSITSIKLPSTLTKICDEDGLQFSNGSGTNQVKVSYQEMAVFEGCESLEAINVAAANTVYTSIDGVLYKMDTAGASELLYVPACYSAQEGIVKIPTTVTRIWGNAFYKNTGAVGIDFGTRAAGSTLDIDPYGFYNAEGLTEITLPEGYATVNPYTFYDCDALTKIVLPNTVTKVRRYGIYYCDVLETLEFKEGNTSAALEIETAGTSGTAASINKCVALREIVFPERTETFGNYAMTGNTGLERVVIPSTVKTIGNYVFQGSTKLTQLEFRTRTDENGKEVSSLTTIGNYAFNKCYGLVDIVLPDGVTTIGDYAFQECSNLESVYVPASVTKIGKYAFTYCKKLADVEIAENSALTTIDNYAFANTALTTFTVPASVTTIGTQAFYCSYDLTTVNFAVNASGVSALKSIGGSAFKETGLTEITLPETSSTLTVGAKAFENCRDLAEVYIPKNVTAIGDMFVFCPAIETITVHPDNANLKSDGTALLNKVESTKAIQHVYKELPAGEYVVPEGIVEIGAYAFAGQGNVTKIVLPASLKKIGNYAFKDCYNLQEVVFAEGTVLTTAGSYMFQWCRNLNKVTIPESMTSLSSYMFDGCTGLTSITLPSTLKTIGTYAFRNTGLTSITIPASVTAIPNYAFSGCASLAQVTLHDKVKSIGNSAFTDCKALAGIDLMNVETIGTNAFQNCSAITSIVIPEGIKTISNYAFDNCAALSSVTLPTSLTSLGNYVFRNCTALTGITLPAALETMGTYAFFNAGLTSIAIPEGMEVINQYAFQKCAALASVTLPSTLKSIYSYAFAGCTSLTSIVLPEGLTELAESSSKSGTKFTSATAVKSYAFADCTALTSITIPSTLTKLGTYAFQNCTGLTSFNLSNIEILGSFAFQNTGLTSVEIPYLTSTTWGQSVFHSCASLTDVTIDSAITEIPSATFQGCAFTNITLPAGLLKFQAGTFRECTELESIVIPEKITDLQVMYLFYGCTSLSEVTILGKVTKIGNSAFYGCTSLETIELPNSVSELGNSAFQNSGLTEITIPKSVGKLGTTVFAGCSNLEKFVVDSANVVFHVGTDGGLYDADGTLLYYPSAAPVENGVLNISADIAKVGSNAFNGNTSIKELVIPAGMTVIDANAFKDMWGLEKVVISEGVEEIGNYAFQNCTALKEVVLPSTLKKIGNNVFYGATALKEIELPANLESLGTNVFYGTALESIVIPASVTELPGSLFVECKSLKNVTFLGELTSIGASAFKNSGITSITLPATVTSLGANAFEGCEALETVVLPAGMSFAGTKTFLNCTSLKNVTLPSDLTEIPANTFQGCTALENITIPENVTVINANAFQGCTALESIVIPAKVHTLGTPLTSAQYERVYNASGSVFADCTSLKSVTFMGAVENVTNNTFQNCTSLESIVFPEGLKYIRNNVFDGCTALKKIGLPDTVEVIGQYAFQNCTSLNDIVIPAKAIVNLQAFSGLTAANIIKVRCSAYTASAGWAYNGTNSWNTGSDATFVWSYTENANA